MRNEPHWVVGDLFGQPIPVGPDTLRGADPQFLTAAFRASGSLSADNSVRRVTGFDEVAGGSTGRKAVLTVEYDKPHPRLPTDLFAKFSRDLDNAVRDRAKTQMEPEVRFAALSRAAGFPIAVPRVFFGDYHRDTGTGILITERITFGSNGIERQYDKCLDFLMPDPLDHYRALLTALARLAGTQRSGRLPASLIEQFPVDLRAATVGEPSGLDARRSDRRLVQLAEFVLHHPGLLPSNVADPDFLARLREDVPRFVAHEDSLMNRLAADADYVALCHWNANVDNAWFWRDDDGVLRCGLLDWGCVGQMNLGMAIWGAMSAAETDLWDHHLDALLQAFTAEVRACGGPVLDPDRLRRDTLLYAAMMGVRWLLDVPALFGKRFGAEMPRDSSDPRIREEESLRAPLQMLANLLNLWDRHRIGDLLVPSPTHGAARHD